MPQPGLDPPDPPAPVRYEPVRPEPRRPEPGGGDPACFLDQVCPVCGRVSERLPSGRCAACGEPWGGD